jgi:hypothetical protein
MMQLQVKLGETKKKFSPRASRQRAALWTPWFWASGFQNYERRNSCSFKLPRFVVICCSSHTRIIYHLWAFMVLLPANYFYDNSHLPLTCSLELSSNTTCSEGISLKLVPGQSIPLRHSLSCYLIFSFISFWGGNAYCLIPAHNMPYPEC